MQSGLRGIGFLRNASHENRIQKYASETTTACGMNSFRFSVKYDEYGFPAVEQTLQSGAFRQRGHLGDHSIGIEPEESGMVQTRGRREALLEGGAADERRTRLADGYGASRQSAVHGGD
jgi:hypothetical protein